MTMFQTLHRMMPSSQDTLKLKCSACGHQDEWTRERAFETLGPDASPYIVRRRLKCGKCMGRDGMVAWI